MEIKKVTQEELLAILRGSNEQQAIERYSYYSKRVFDGEIDFQEEQKVDSFFDYIADHYENNIGDPNELKRIAEENGLVYIDDVGLEAISLLKEYNPVRYAQLGNKGDLFNWAWKMSDNRTDRYKEIKKIAGFDSVKETYLNELISLIKSDHYFSEAPSETYFGSEQSFIFDTPRAALFHEYMTKRLFTEEERKELVQNYREDSDQTDKLTEDMDQWLELNKENRQWLFENSAPDLLFNESVLNFVEELDALEDVVS